MAEGREQEQKSRRERDTSVVVAQGLAEQEVVSLSLTTSVEALVHKFVCVLLITFDGCLN